MEGVAGARDSLTKNFGLRFEEWTLFSLGMALLVLAFIFMPQAVMLALQIALFLAPVWLPFLLIHGALTIWLILRRAEFIDSQKYVLLELKPPRNLVKTPLAMETFLSAIHLGPGESTWYVRWIKGAVRPFFSLELASIGGQVHFFIWTRANFRPIIEAQLYSQYPGAQVVEAPDYARRFDPFARNWSVWGCDFVHTADAPLPIKTYVEFGLDRVQKEPEQVDPMASIIEFLGSLGKGEELWLQFVIRTHKGEKYNKLNKAGKPFTWKDEARELIDKIRQETKMPFIDSATGKEMPGMPLPTKGQSDKIAAIERNVSKLAFDVGVRGIYLADQEHFRPIIITFLTNIFKAFNTEGWNGIKPNGWMTSFDDYPWEIGIEHAKEHTRHGVVEAYRRRQFFYEPFGDHGTGVGELMVMSTEELATIFHIPSGSVQTPSLGRIQSATGEPPANLPT